MIVAAVVSLLAWLFGRSRSAVGLRTALRGMSGRVQDSRWQLAVRIAAGVIALVLVLVLVSASLTFVWAVLVALLAGLAAVVAAISPRGPVPAAPAVADQRRPPAGRLTRQPTEKLAIIAMSSCSRLWQWKTYRPG